MSDNILKTNPLLRAIALPIYRARTLSGYLLPSLREGVRWLRKSRETTNFTYDLTAKNKEYLSCMMSVVTGIPVEELDGYIREIEEDRKIQVHVATITAASDLSFKADAEARFHKRIGWYALARAIKPKVIVETGVDKGLGSVVLCSALLRNRAEGYPGHYYGTDFNPKAGYLLCGEYAEVVKSSMETHSNPCVKCPARLTFSSMIVIIVQNMRLMNMKQ